MQALLLHKGNPMATHTIVTIAGSLRKESFTLKIANALAKLAPPALKLDVVTLHGISFFNQDLEATPPADWVAFRERIQKSAGVIFVTPEYNHGTSGALKNAIDFLFAEWNNKAAGFVSYGGASGARAVEQLRLNLAEVQMATVRLQVLFSMYTDFENFSVFKPDSRKETSVNEMLDQLVAWGGALKTLRKKTA